MKIASLQLKVYREKEKNLEQLAEWMKCEKLQDVDMVTLPEMFTCPYQTELFPLYAEKEGGPSCRFFSDLAKKYGIYLSAGTIPEVDENGRIYNTAYVYDRTGNQIAKHRKMHLFDIDIQDGQTFRESDTLSAGDEVTVFDTEFCRMGICICYDLRFPELAGLMAQEGAKVLLVPAAFNMTTGPAHWELLFRQRAVDNQFYTIGTAPARDMGAEYHSWGHTIAVDPWGTVVHVCGEAEQIQITEINLELVDKIRRELPLLRHRRGDVYEVRKR
ncbi:carbon-nitrogen hydrolase family protein [Hespellia stercorisuis]|uniref:Predicted amidohydrolase n=1 Tax=Hespellia stercorisuis DSM 15480 TaxID=1121950 RepID=A0A1M6PJF3_9FIRM|nr:carbon-nitrogen hydrolase family protein [Hespellia stercorisuis]SHK08024.1 Predicted amidohydrolase [Hespellia stercorisuis DSM 15480]